MANRPRALDPHVFAIEDLEEHGGTKLPKMYREFYNEGAMDMISLRDNIAAFNRYRILPRALRNVENVDTSTEIFGTRVAFPLGLAPSAMHKLAHPEGEVATSRAAASMNISMCLSSYATSSIEEVAEQGTGNPYMMQMCALKDRSKTKQIVDRAEAVGCKALFLSVDVPLLGRRLNEFRNNFTLPPGLGFPNILSDGREEFEDEKTTQDYDASLEWADIIPWLRENTKMQIWLKGILNPADVERAIEYGVDGVLISNHGGRQLDGVPATLDCLRECAYVARGRIQIAVDGGIRRGSDIFKAIALGAQHCFIGRVVIWGLAYNGQAGVELGLKLLLEEFRNTMVLAGCRTISDITSDHLIYLGPSGRLHKLHVLCKTLEDVHWNFNRCVASPAPAPGTPPVRT